MIRSSAVRRTALLLAFAGLLAGCHTYRTVDQPTPGSTVRVSVPISSALSSPNRSPQSAAVEGRLVSAGDTLVLAVQNRQSYGAYREVVRYDTLRLASAQASSVEVREFSKNRSIVLGTAVAAVVTGAAALAFGWGGGSTNTTPPGGGGPEPAIVATPSLIASIWGLVVR